jgi:hypothetical protein
LANGIWVLSWVCDRGKEIMFFKIVSFFFAKDL